MARCGGAIMGAPTKIQKARRIEDSADALFDWIMTCTDGTCSKDIARAYADVAGPNVDWSMRSPRNTWVSVTSRWPWPRQTSAQPTGGTTERLADASTPRVANTRSSASNWRKPFRAPTGPRQPPDNTANSGPELFDPLLACIEKQSNIEAVFNTALVKLVTNAEGVVIGVEAEGAGGREFYKASKGVMLATGGFPAGLEMQERFCQDALDYSTYMCKDCTGDGVKAPWP